MFVGNMRGHLRDRGKIYNAYTEKSTGFQTSDHPAHSLVTILTTLAWLLDIDRSTTKLILKQQELGK
jgi:hypothetical protein